MTLNQHSKLLKNDIANKLKLRKQETEELIKDLKKIKDCHQLNISELYLKCSTLQHLAQFSDENVDFLLKSLEDQEEGLSKSELVHKIAKEIMHKCRGDTSKYTLYCNYLFCSAVA